jgi:flagellar biogenesis protein FliO
MKGLSTKMPEKLVSIIMAILVILFAVWLLRTLGKIEGFQEGAAATSANRAIGGASRTGGTTKSATKK